MNPSSSTDRTKPELAPPVPQPRGESNGDRSDITRPGEYEMQQFPGPGQDQPAGGDSQALDVLDNKPSEEAQDEQPTLDELGINILMWRRRVRSHLDEWTTWAIKRRRAATEKYLRRTERKRVFGAIENALRSIEATVVNYTTIIISLNILSSISAILLLLAPPVIAFFLVQPDVSGWGHVGAAGLALVVYLVWYLLATYSIYLWIKLRSPQRGVKLRRGQLHGNPASALTFPLIVFLLLLAVIPAMVAGLPLRLQDALPLRFQAALSLRFQFTPPWLNHGLFHAAFAAVAWVFGVWLIILISTNMSIRIYSSLVWRRISSRLPEEQFIARTTDLITSISTKDDGSGEGTDALITPLQLVHVMEDIANNFEQYWPRHLQTGYGHVDRSARIWARQAAAAIRAQEFPILLGQHRPVDMSAPLTKVVVKVIFKRAFVEAPKDNRSYRRAVWWRRLGRPALASILLIATAALIFVAVWQPGLPQVLKAWGQTGLASAISLPNDLRPGVLAAAIAVFGVFIKVVAPSGPDKAGRGELDM